MNGRIERVDPNTARQLGGVTPEPVPPSRGRPGEILMLVSAQE
jgi:hypothetical protein